MRSRALVQGILIPPFLAVLLASTPLPQPSETYGARIEALVAAEAQQLELLSARFASAPDEVTARKTQQHIDLVKRTAELRLFELQLEESERRGLTEDTDKLRAVVDDLRKTVVERSAVYEIEIPVFETNVPEMKVDGR